MIEIREQIAMAPLTTFEIGGVAKYYAEVNTEEEIREAIRWARKHKEPFVVLAGGSNVLIRDAGIDGLVIRLKGTDFKIVGKTLTADMGCNLLTLIRGVSAKGLGGWEKLAGIPGTIGGATRGNAGAFGTEIKDFVKNVRALNTGSLEMIDLVGQSCEFSYRHSYFKDHPEWIILDVAVRLLRVDPKGSAQLIEETIAEREKRHLQNVRAAGSFFMNPVAPRAVQELFEREKGVSARQGRVPAGWLIEKVGMKGAMIGDAQASLQHPNYLVNTGNATAEDVRELAKKIKKAVEKQFGVKLEEEAALIGFTE